MGFSGGGSNILKPHTHSAAILQDGGNLDFDNVTQGDLAAGDIVYSNGVAMQKLAIGSPAQNLRVNGAGTAPEYYTTAADVGSLELILSDTSIGGLSVWTSPAFSANMKTTYSELILVANFYWLSPYTEFGSVAYFLNGITTGYNDSFGYYYDGSANTNVVKATTTRAYCSGAELGLSSGEGLHIETTMAQNDATTNTVNFHSYSTSSSGTSLVLDTFLDIGATDIISEIKIQASLAGWATGSNISLYGRKIT